MSPEYNESFELSTQLGRQALPLVEELKIPATPISYAVFYEYFSGHNPGLNKAVDLLRKNADVLTAERVQLLYETYINPSINQVIKDLREVAGDLFKTTQGNIARAHEESKQYQSDLDMGARQLEEAKDRKEWQLITQRLIEETRQMQNNSKRLTQELSNVYSELDELRQECHQVRQESMSDPLTGLKNRRAFDTEIEKYCARVRKDKSPLSLLMVDIDHFKQINDTYGHVTGDRVLRWVATMIKETVRDADVVARYGGEEFAILLPDTMLDGAEHIGENICRRVNSQTLKNSDQGQKIGKITVSLGLARYRTSESVEQFICRADEALYLAKSNGRNQLCRYNLKMDVAS